MTHYGSVNGDGNESSVRLTVQNGNGGTERIAFVIDTGATGSMVLPQEIIDRLNLPLAEAEYVQVTQADGTTGRYSVYIVQVLWHDRLKEFEVVAFGAVPLIGMGLIQGSNLNIDAIPGGLVTITELPALS